MVPLNHCSFNNMKKIKLLSDSSHQIITSSCVYKAGVEVWSDITSVDVKIDAGDVVGKNISLAREGIYDKDTLRYFTRYNETK